MPRSPLKTRPKPRTAKKSLESLLSQPFGYVLVAMLVVGLLAFAGWHVMQATRDVDHHGTQLKSLVIRTGLLAGGIIYGALAFFAAGLLIGSIRRSGGSGGSQTRDLLAHLLS